MDHMTLTGVCSVGAALQIYSIPSLLSDLATLVWQFSVVQTNKGFVKSHTTSSPRRIDIALPGVHSSERLSKIQKFQRGRCYMLVVCSVVRIFGLINTHNIATQ